MIIWCVSNNILEDQNTYLIGSLNFFFHTISIEKMYMLIKYEGLANIFNENIHKSNLWMDVILFLNKIVWAKNTLKILYK